MPSPRRPKALQSSMPMPPYEPAPNPPGIHGSTGLLHANAGSNGADPESQSDARPLQPRPVIPLDPNGRMWFWIHTVLDLFTTIGVLLVYAIVDGVEPRAGYMVFPTLYKHSYPYKDNTVPSAVVPIYSIGGPLVAFLVWKLADRRRLVTWYDFYRTFLSLLFVCFLTGAITSALKVAIARPRPNFFFKCWPNGVAVWLNQNQFGGYPLCSVPSSDVAEYRKSFPSGHSSFSAAGCGYLTFWLLGQLQCFVRSKDRAWAFVIALIPSIGAIIVGVTRITDYWHNVSDVCFGLALGFWIAFICYVMLYPFFTNPLCYVPRYVLAADDKARDEAKANS